MSLTSALDSAKSSLLATQTQTAIVSRNIANLNDPNASRKYANVVTGPGGRVEVTSIARSQNSVLYRNMLDSTSAVGSWSAISSGYQRLDETIGDTTLSRSPSAMISGLSDRLLALSGNPGSFEFARTALDAARDLAANLNDLSATVQAVRRDADNSLLHAAEDMNAILADIERLNEKVVSGTVAGSDVTDFVDKRDAAVARLSAYVGVNARIRGDNDLVLHTDSGVNLFDKRARLVEFTPSSPLGSGQSGSALRIDGVQVTGEGAFMPLRSGSVVGLTQLRDEIAPTFEAQLDELARGLVEAFSETVGGEKRSGLFTVGADGEPVREGASHGFAASLRVDARAAADPTLIRDGINIAPPAGAGSGYTDRIAALYEALGSSRAYSTEAGLAQTGSLANFAASSLGWLQAGRASALSEVEYRTTLNERTRETMSNETGINLAQEMTLLTDLQRSYQASAKLISTVDEMLAALLQTV